MENMMDELQRRYGPLVTEQQHKRAATVVRARVAFDNGDLGEPVLRVYDDSRGQQGRSCNYLLAEVWPFERTYLVKHLSVPNLAKVPAATQAADYFRSMGRPDLAENVAAIATGEPQSVWDLIDDDIKTAGAEQQGTVHHGAVVTGPPGQQIELACVHHGPCTITRADLRSQVKAARSDGARRKAMLDVQRGAWV